VNWQHLRAFLWLRWRLMANQSRRAGALNAVLTMVVMMGALAMAIPLFIATIMLGLYLIPQAAPVHLMYAWDALIVGFLFFWGIGVIIELQRTEPLSLAKFLHLPVSVEGAFLINYISSLLRLALIAFGPLMFGFGLALVFARGILLLPVLPSLAAFLLMITALTYQLQGWLGTMMENPRRRRTVVMAITASFILVTQAPNFLSFLAPRMARQSADRQAAFLQELAKLDSARTSEEIDAETYRRGREEAERKHKVAAEEAERKIAENGERIARLVNLVLPVGWLPLGVVSAAEGDVRPSLMGLLGMTLIGTLSLRRAYRTTIRMYQGESSNRKGRPAPAAASPLSARKPGALLLEARPPGLSEPVSAIALGGLRSLMRAPEAKMMMLTPLILTPVFGSMLWQGRHDLPELVRPLVATGAMLFVLLGLLQLMGNQFGFDRDGFRVFVLCAAPRREILLGKNLAYAPLALGMALFLLACLQIVCPLRLDHLLAMFPQYISMFLLFCLVTNLLSIYAPFPVAAGSLKSSSPKLSTVLLQFLMFFILFPLTQAPTLLPLGLEALAQFLGWWPAAPICLVLTLAECTIVVVLYRFALGWQGRIFQAREQRILETVTSRAS
jgi:ABC-2 type transport system permease protein